MTENARPRLQEVNNYISDTFHTRTHRAPQASRNGLSERCRSKRGQEQRATLQRTAPMLKAQSIFPQQMGTGISGLVSSALPDNEMPKFWLVLCGGYESRVIEEGGLVWEDFFVCVCWLLLSASTSTVTGFLPSIRVCVRTSVCVCVCVLVSSLFPRRC